MTTRSLIAAATVATTLLSPSAQAGDVHVEAGLPGLIVGYAAPLSDRLGWRVDASTLGAPSQDRTIGAIDYHGRLRVDRVALRAD